MYLHTLEYYITLIIIKLVVCVIGSMHSTLILATLSVCILCILLVVASSIFRIQSIHKMRYCRCAATTPARSEK